MSDFCLPPPRAPDSELTRNELFLIEGIKWHSRFSACETTTNRWVEYFGWKPGKIKSTLKSLKAKGRVQMVTSPGRKNEDGDFVRKRIIFLVSECSPEEGALLLASFIEDRGGRHPFNGPQFAGPLQCTGGQLHNWKRTAFQEGYITQHFRDDREILTTVRGSFTPVPLPRKGRQFSKLLNMKKRDLIKQRLNGGMEITADKIAHDMDLSPRHISEILNNIDGIQIRRTGQGGKKVYALRDTSIITEEEKSVLSALDRSPQTSEQIKRMLGREGNLRALADSLRSHGVIKTKFGGNMWVWSKGPLSEAFVAEIRRAQKERKRETDRLGKERRALGISKEQQDLIRDAMDALSNAYEHRLTYSTPSAHLERLRIEAGRFRCWVTQAKVTDIVKSWSSDRGPVTAAALANEVVSRLGPAFKEEQRRAA